MSTEARTDVSKNQLNTPLALALFTGIAVAILIAYYFPLLAQGMSFYASDHNFYFEPFARFIGEAYRNLTLPLWNPYVYSGMPQISVPSPGVFYPPNLIWALTTYGVGLALILIFHQLLAGVGAFLLIESFGWGIGPSFMAGSICAFCGYMFSLNTNHTLVTTAAWIPLNLWLMNKLKRSTHPNQTYLYVVFASLALVLLIGAGRPEVSVIGMFIVLMFVVAQSNFWTKDEEKRQAGVANLSWQALAFFIAALLSMPFVLPTAEWMLGSPRAQGMDVKWVFTWSANWYDLICLIFAQPFGDLQTLGSPYAGVAASRPNYLPYIPSVLVGPVAATLSVWAVCDRGWPYKKWLLFLLIGTFLMMIGQHTVIIPKLFSLVPAATLFRYPIKLAVILAFCLAVLSSRGVYALCAGKITTRSCLLTLTLWAVTFAIGQCTYIFALFNNPIPYPTLANHAPAQIVLGLAIMSGSAVGLLVNLLGWLVVRKTMDWRLGSIILNALVILSLVIPAFQYRPRVTTNDFFDSPSWLLTQMQKFGWKNEGNEPIRLLLLYTEPLQKPGHFMWRPNSSFNENYYQYCRQLLLPQTNMDYHVCETYGYEAALSLEYETHLLSFTRRSNEELTAGSESEAFQHNRDLPLAQFARSSATGFVVSQVYGAQGERPELDRLLFDPVVDSEAMNLRIYKVRNPLPRAFVSSNWHWMKDHKDAIRTTQTPGFTHFDPAQPIIEHLPSDSPSYSVAMPANYNSNSEANAPANANLSADQSGGVLTQAGLILPGKNLPKTNTKEQNPIFLKDTADHISISVNLTKPSFLVLSDRYYPGWKAKVDSVPAPIFRANGMFRAVFLPKGGHLIDFDYEPDSLIIAVYIAAAGMILDAVLLLVVSTPGLTRAFKRMAGQPV